MQKIIDFINENIIIFISVFALLFILIVVLLIRAIIITKNKSQDLEKEHLPKTKLKSEKEISKQNKQKEIKTIPSKNMPKQKETEISRPVLVESANQAEDKQSKSNKASEGDDFYSRHLNENLNYDYSKNPIANEKETISKQEQVLQPTNSSSENYKLKIAKLVNGEYRFKIEKEEKNVLLSKNFPSFNEAKENSEILKDLITNQEFEVGEGQQGYKFYLKHNGEFLVSSINFLTIEEAKIEASKLKISIINNEF